VNAYIIYGHQDGDGDHGSIGSTGFGGPREYGIACYGTVREGDAIGTFMSIEDLEELWVAVGIELARRGRI
jgi:hypothetical protein